MHFTNGMYTDMWMKGIIMKAKWKLPEEYFMTNNETVTDIDSQRYIPTRSGYCHCGAKTSTVLLSYPYGFNV